MTDAGYVLAAYGVILGGLALYAVTLWRRLRGEQGFGMSFGNRPWTRRDGHDGDR